MFNFECAVRLRFVPGLQGDRGQYFACDHYPLLLRVDRGSGDISFAPPIASAHGHALNAIDLFALAGPDLMERGKTSGAYPADGAVEFFGHGSRIPGFYAWDIEQLPWIETAIFSWRLVDLVHLFKLQFWQIAPEWEIKDLN